MCVECLRPKIHRCAEEVRSHGWVFNPGGAKSTPLRLKVKGRPTAAQLLGWQLSTADAKARTLSRLFSQAKGTAKAKAKALGTVLQAPPPAPPGAPGPSWPLDAVEWGTAGAETSEPQRQYEYEQILDPNNERIWATFKAKRDMPPKHPPALLSQTDWRRALAEANWLRASDEAEDEGTVVDDDTYPGTVSKAAVKAAAKAVPWWLRQQHRGKCSWV